MSSWLIRSKGYHFSGLFSVMDIPLYQKWYALLFGAFTAAFESCSSQPGIGRRLAFVVKTWQLTRYLVIGTLLFSLFFTTSRQLLASQTPFKKGRRAFVLGCCCCCCLPGLARRAAARPALLPALLLLSRSSLAAAFASIPSLSSLFAVPAFVVD